MSQVELVALWAGLLSSVVGIVLSVVAIVFSWVVNKRADRIGDHTIQSLQKIESTVATLSDNTTGLIKAAWDKMLGNVGGETAAGAPGVREIAAGVAAEIRDELKQRAGAQPDPKDVAASVEQALQRLEKAISRSRTQGFADAGLLDHVLSELKSLPPEARELFLAIRPRHVTNDQYRVLTKSPLRDAITQLRDVGLLVPRTGIEDDKDVRVYYYPNGVYRVVEAVGTLLPPVPPSVREMVHTELTKAGYGSASR